MTKIEPPLKKIFFAAAMLALGLCAAVFVYRYQIMQYSAEKAVRGLLPDYITAEKIDFNFKDSKIVLGNFKILNPPNFSCKYLAEIGEVKCGYRMKSKNILDGVEILNPVFKGPALSVERLADGRTNIQEMPNFLQKKDQEVKTRIIAEPKAAVSAGGGSKGRESAKMAVDNSFSKMVKLPEDFIVKDGKVTFMDGMVGPGPHIITFENIDATLRLKLDSTYTKALNISTAGTGIVNGKSGEIIKWDTKFDPTAPQLTMSNRFNVSGVNIMTFLPYYDKYSPFALRSGYFSGEFIFDFDNGSIGSTNEVSLSRLSFTVKKGYENAQYLETTVPDLVKYFTSSSGDIIFDFKIKGRLPNPQFYLGPISKQAVASMAIDKVGKALAAAAKDQAGSSAVAAGQKSDMEKASEYINMFKGLLKDKE